MERRRHASAISTLLLGATLIAIATLTAACEENPVGRECFIGLDAGTPSQAIVASPALECQSRTCLRVPNDRSQLPEGSEYTNLCTAECSADEDCDRVPESPCQTGFTCAVPVVVGPFCCRKLCVCKDYLVLPDGGAPAAPEACNPDNEENTCCNLPGREQRAECQ
jgi:hypothetical protein